MSKLAGIHGLRFAAAMMVLASHVSPLTEVPAPDAIGWLVPYLGSGVFLFFVISAFSLCYSTSLYGERPDWIRLYVFKRFFRIAPLFYVVLIATALYQWKVNGVPTSPSIMAIDASFLFGLYPGHHGSIVFGGWTLGVEMIFYSMFPVILAIVRGRAQAFAALAICIALGWEALQIEDPATSIALHWQMALPVHLQFFAAGFLGYFLFASPTTNPRVAAPVFAISCAALLLFMTLLTHHLSLQRSTAVLFLIFVPMFTALCTWQAMRPSRPVANRFTVYWGERSFSIYLMHGPVLFAVAPLCRPLAAMLGASAGYAITFLVSTTCVLAVSATTYALIEKPGMRIGQMLFDRSNPFRSTGWLHRLFSGDDGSKAAAADVPSPTT